MNARAAKLAPAYGSALQDYLARPAEAQRSRAYELGRAWLADGFGVLEVVAAHGEFLRRLHAGRPAAADFSAALRNSFDFLAECLAPFEMSHRGAREGGRAWHRLNETLENEAKRIAHMLHDEAGQLLATVHIALADLAEELPPKSRARLGEVEWLLGKIETELRNVSHELRPLVLDRLGLLSALRMLAENVARRAGIRISVSGDESGRIPPVMEITLYRIVQEALANAVRHARACRVSIEFQILTGRVQCTVSDDGVGFAPEQLERSEGLGIIGIRERLNALGGMLRIDSRPKSGTTLQVELPLRTQHAVPSAARR